MKAIAELMHEERLFEEGDETEFLDAFSKLSKQQFLDEGKVSRDQVVFDSVFKELRF